MISQRESAYEKIKITKNKDKVMEIEKKIELKYLSEIGRYYTKRVFGNIKSGESVIKMLYEIEQQKIYLLKQHMIKFEKKIDKIINDNLIKK